jgi:hypothetical protein
MKSRRPAIAAMRLPAELRPLFWDHDFTWLGWPRDADLIIGRVLTAGDWDALCWLIRMATKPALREWIVQREGGALSPRQLRFWELMLNLPHREVTRWIKDPARQVWEGRHIA